MKIWSPKDLDDMAPLDVARELFGEDISTPESSWSLERRDSDNKAFFWKDRRLGLAWRTTHGYLISLHEVSAPGQAKEFASRNKIQLFENGGLYLKSTAELLIRCSRLPPPGMPDSDDLYRIRTVAGVEAIVGYSSLLFRRLVSQPAVEMNRRLPDPRTLTTLVLRGIDLKEVSATAELALHYLREHMTGIQFGFWPLPELHRAPEIEDIDELAKPVSPRDPVADTSRPEAVAFFNRAQESDPITSFLYFYRVLEACFEDILKDEISSWRADSSIGAMELMTRFRSIQQREDVSALRKVLGLIVDQKLLDKAFRDKLISESSADALTDQIYKRRNSIAHGRRGQHDQVLVPFCFSLGNDSQHTLWRDLMAELAHVALNRWILRV